MAKRCRGNVRSLRLAALAGLAMQQAGPVCAKRRPGPWKAKTARGCVACAAVAATVLALGDVAAWASSPASTGAFAPLVNKVMGVLVKPRLTTVPLKAPAGPLSPLGWPFDPMREGQLQAGAWVEATPSSYLVTVGACSPFGPPPAHAVVGTSCNGETASGAELGGESNYGAKAYPTDAKALGSLAAPAPKGRPSAVPLGAGVVGQEYTYRSVSSYKVVIDHRLVDWAVGKWHFRADFSGCPAALAGALVPAAKGIRAFADAHPLPTGPGLVVFQNACGDTTSMSGTVTWVAGRDVYSTFAFDSYSVPMLLASMMRPYP